MPSDPLAPRGLPVPGSHPVLSLLSRLAGSFPTASASSTYPGRACFLSNGGKAVGSSQAPTESLSWGPGAHPRDPSMGSWAGGAGVGVSAPNHQALLLHLSWLRSLGGGWAEGPCLAPQRLTGHRLPGAEPPPPLKGALCHHKAALSLSEKLGCCHGDRGGLGRRGPAS